MAGSVVGEDKNDRILAQARVLQKGDKTCEVAVCVIEHAGECGLQAREEAPLIGRVLIPRLNAVIARRQARSCGHDAHLDLAGEAALSFDVPAALENRIVTADDVHRRLMRRMSGAEGKPEEPWRRRLLGHVAGKKLN